MAKHLLRISDAEAVAEAVNDFASLLARARADAEAIIEHDARPIAVIRTVTDRNVGPLSESLRLARERGSTATLDGEIRFAISNRP